MKRIHSFTHDIEFEYSDTDSCDTTNRKFINNDELQRICKGIIGKECISNDLEIYSEQISARLDNCKKWYSIPSDQRKLRLSNSTRAPHIKYVIDPYNTKIDIVNGQYNGYEPIRMCIDTGNETLSIVNSNNLPGLDIITLMATTDMIFTYNLLVKEEFQIKSIYEEDILDIKFINYESDIIQNVQYPKTTQEDLYKKCLKANLSDEDIQQIGFRITNGICGGQKFTFNLAKVKVKIDGIDREFEFICDVDDQLYCELLVGYSDIAILYKNGIDIGFNPLILEYYYEQEHIKNYAKYYYRKFKLLDLISSKGVSYGGNLELQIHKDNEIMYSRLFEKFDLIRIPAYKL